MRALIPDAAMEYLTGLNLRRVAARLVVFSVFWFLLTGGDFGTWYLGAAAVVLATAISLSIVPREPGWRWTVSGTARFVPFFLWQSLSGGTDVALRALRPDMPLEPDLVEYESSLSNPTALAFMVAVVSLLPGTLGTEVDGKKIYIH